MTNSERDRLVDQCDAETKLAIASWTVEKIDEFGKNPGSFRHLIYGLMGFGPESYVLMYNSGGMNLTNELDYDFRKRVRSLIREKKIEDSDLKRAFLICDEPHCFNYSSCGFPSESGYRHTCYEHSNFLRYDPQKDVDIQ